MSRPLLLLLTAVLLSLGAWAAPSAQAAPADDCCPSSVEDEHDEPERPDCCDVDLGACCANGVAVIPPSPTLQSLAGAFVPTSATLPRAALYRTRATGPPPTPPPIG